MYCSVLACSGVFDAEGELCEEPVCCGEASAVGVSRRAETAVPGEAGETIAKHRLAQKISAKRKNHRRRRRSRPFANTARRAVPKVRTRREYAAVLFEPQDFITIS
ncbi:MAG: hypothetical protein AUH16_09470 [Acidobacteria bacterium 13_2_20CM_57_7]|nr:MAG: hypothetical protein AUH16_09470 [Acidobacteria bacterium 13_2_20CM_57_7]